MAFTGPMEDRLAIRELHDSYGDAVFRADGDEWAATWTEDGVWSLMGNDIQGRDRILATWRQLMGGFSLAAFFASPGDIRVDGDRATGRCYVTEILRETNGNVRRIIGAYEDTLVKQGGRWLFARRNYRILQDEQTPAGAAKP